LLASLTHYREIRISWFYKGRYATYAQAFHHFAPKPSEGTFIEEIKHHIFVYGIVILFSILLHTRNRLLKAENEKLQAELSNLKAQIHPHFLFNTLNSIYALAIRKDDKTPETIIRLSEFMRYLLKDVNQSQVSLEKEITYIENYLDLQKSRLRNSVSIEYLCSGNFSTKQIAPLYYLLI
jgi:LytS/YehU family sensor histidine kinase